MSLQNLSCREVFDQFQVGLKKIELRQVATLGPENFAEDAVLHLSAVTFHGEKTKLDRASVWIFVNDPRNLVANDGFDSELLFEFAAQRVAWLLSLFDFSARDLPLQSLANKRFRTTID